jgi:hypothetical protein
VEDRLPVERPEDCPFVAEQLAQCRGTQLGAFRCFETERLQEARSEGQEVQPRQPRIEEVPLDQGKEVLARRQRFQIPRGQDQEAMSVPSLRPEDLPWRIPHQRCRREPSRRKTAERGRVDPSKSCPVRAEEMARSVQGNPS